MVWSVGVASASDLGREIGGGALVGVELPDEAAGHRIGDGCCDVHVSCL